MKTKTAATVQERQTAYAVLRDNGYTIRNAGVAVGYSPASVPTLATKVEPKRRAGLLSPLAPLAKKAVKSILKGHPVGAAEIPKSSDVLRASEIVLDRIDPKTQHIEQRNLSVSLTLSPAERERILTALGLGTAQPSLPNPQDLVLSTASDGDTGKESTPTR